MTTTDLVYRIQGIYVKNAPVRTRPLGAVGKAGTNMYSPRPGWLRDSSWMIQSDTFIVSEDLVGYVKYAEVTSRRPHFIENTNADFLHQLSAMGGKIERL